MALFLPSYPEFGLISHIDLVVSVKYHSKFQPLPSDYQLICLPSARFITAFEFLGYAKMKTLIPIPLVLFSSLINVVIAKGYFTTCEDSYQLSGSVMDYTCYAENGQRISSSIDLDLCVTNSNGYLQQHAKLVYPNTALNAAIVQYILKDIPYIAANTRQLAWTVE
jgi:hypothetical protein